MSVILNPRGTSGAGKTELARRIMRVYGWERNGQMEPIYRAGRKPPVCYRFRHPLGGRPLVVLGHYERSCGGCDTLGDMDEVFQLAHAYASRGHDVLFEGLRVSREYERSVSLAESHALHILSLSTPLDQCIRNVVTRRRARKDVRPGIATTTETERRKIEHASGRLRGCARVEPVSFDEALHRARELLGLAPPEASG